MAEVSRAEFDRVVNDIVDLRRDMRDTREGLAAVRQEVKDLRYQLNHRHRRQQIATGSVASSIAVLVQLVLRLLGWL